MSAFLLGTFLSINVLAADNIPSNENLQELKLGQSPLVDEYNSKAAEESRIAAQDDSSEFVKYIKNTYQKISNSFNNSFIKNSGWKLLLKGLLITIEISFFAVILGIFLGFLIGIIRSTYDKTGRFRFLNSISKIYITVIRGTPVVVQLMIIYFVIFQNVDVSRIVAAIIAFGINSGAYVAEIFRSGIMSIDNGQMEAGRSLGLTYSQSMRSIIMPQALKNVLPALGNELIVLLKETSVAGYIALGDLTRVGDSIKTTQYENFWPLFGVAAIYLSIVMGLTKLLSILERRLRASDSR
ncbi:MAG TPA: amino acid ABC transporter permease [Clostridiales bacterium]|nr:amino acid ABC transporter permease [Clostridiales bacterium]